MNELATDAPAARVCEGGCGAGERACYYTCDTHPICFNLNPIKSMNRIESNQIKSNQISAVVASKQTNKRLCMPSSALPPRRVRTSGVRVQARHERGAAAPAATGPCRRHAAGRPGSRVCVLRVVRLRVGTGHLHRDGGRVSPRGGRGRGGGHTHGTDALARRRERARQRRAARSKAAGPACGSKANQMHLLAHGAVP